MALLMISGVVPTDRGILRLGRVHRSRLHVAHRTRRGVHDAWFGDGVVIDTALMIVRWCPGLLLFVSQTCYKAEEDSTHRDLLSWVIRDALRKEHEVLLLGDGRRHVGGVVHFVVGSCCIATET